MKTDVVYNEDCLFGLKRIPDKSVDLIVTDPPYKVATTGEGGTINNISKLNKSLKDLTNAGITQGYDIKRFNIEFVRVMKSINIYIWCNKVQIPEYFNFYVNELDCKFDILCWHKTNALPTYANKYLSDTEYCLYFRKGKGKCFPQSYDDARTFSFTPINAKDKKQFGHPTIKPLDFTEKLIRNSSNEGKIVLDPFMGSGTTAVAAINTNRHYIGYELNTEYFNLIQNRIANVSNIPHKTVVKYKRKSLI